MRKAKLLICTSPKKSVAVLRALENQRKRQIHMMPPSSPLKSDGKNRGTGYYQREQQQQHSLQLNQQQFTGRCSPPGCATLSVSVENWRWRVMNNESMHMNRDSTSATLSETNVPLNTTTTLGEMSIKSLPGTNIDVELPHSSVNSISDDGLRDNDIEFGICITQFHVQITHNSRGVHDGVAGSRGNESAWSPKHVSGAGKGEKSWTVWRTARELLDMHDQIVLVNNTTQGESAVYRGSLASRAQ